MNNSFNLRSAVLWACCLFGGNLVSAASCNADNCLRALFPTQSPAVYSSDAAFCATFTASRDTRTTGFPSKASAACGTAASRYSSACSCKPTISSTLISTRTPTMFSTSPTISSTPSTSSSMSSTVSSTSSTISSISSSTSTTPSPSCTPYTNYNDAVTNGDFECGLAPWIAADLPGNTNKVSSPGDNSKFAYEFDQIGPISPDTNFAPASLSQDLRTVAGVPYNLRFRAYFDKCTQSEGFVGVMIDRQPVYTVDACDKQPAGVFQDNLVPFTAMSDSTNLRFEFLIFETSAVVKIDNVSVIPLH